MEKVSAVIWPQELLLQKVRSAHNIVVCLQGSLLSLPNTAYGAERCSSEAQKVLSKPRVLCAHLACQISWVIIKHTPRRASCGALHSTRDGDGQTWANEIVVRVRLDKTSC